MFATLYLINKRKVAFFILAYLAKVVVLVTILMTVIVYYCAPCVCIRGIVCGF